MVKAAVLKSPEIIETEEFPFPGNGTIIETEATGVCGTDPHVFNNSIETPHPLIMGHELLGRVHKLDAKSLSKHSDRIDVGDRVFVAPGIDCHECFYCENVGSLCDDRKFYGINMSSESPPHLHGGFSEFLALKPDTTLLKVPDRMPTDVAVLIEPMACGIRAVKQAFPNIDKIKNSTVVIIGVGPIGLFATAVAKLYDARKIIVIDRLPHRLEFAKQFGADLTADRSQYEGYELSQHVKRESNNGIGADAVIACTGEVESVEYGLPMLRKGGRFVEKGVYAEVGNVKVSPSAICTRNIEFVGTSYTFLQDFRDAIDVLKKMDFPYQKVVTDKFGIDEVRKAISAVIARECMKVIIDPTINS